MFSFLNRVVSYVMLSRFQRFLQSVYVDIQVSFQVLTLSSDLHENPTRNSFYSFSCDCSDLTQKASLNDKSSM
jgi:hypothetical protein